MFQLEYYKARSDYITEMRKEHFEVINQIFDHVYVLTLERATDRHSLFSENFIGLNFEFFYGTDRRKINFDSKEWEGTLEDLASTGIDLKKINKLYERQSAPMHPGEVACSLGHFNIYKDVVKRGFKKVLILEDDAIFYPDQVKETSKYLEELPSHWDLLYLGYRGHEKVEKKGFKSFFYVLCHYLSIAGWNKIPMPMISRQFPKEYSNYWMASGEHFCTHAYAVSLPFAERLIEMQTPIQYISDRLLTFALLKDYTFKGFAANKSLIGQLEEFPELQAKSYINTD